MASALVISAEVLQIAVVVMLAPRNRLRERKRGPESRIDRSSFPGYGQVLADQAAGADVGQVDTSGDEAGRTRFC